MRRAILAALVVAATTFIEPAAAGALGPLRAPTPPRITASPAGWPESPATTAAAHVLVDAATGQVLAERSAVTPRPVASTIKVLTALTVLNRTSPDEIVEIGDEVLATGGASVGLRPGDRWTVGALLDALVVRSGNDAATALATHVGGSVDGFVSLMRRDARDLGVTGAVIESPSGLEDRNRLSAMDLATIARAAMDDPRFREIAARLTVTLPRLGTQQNRNLLLERLPGATGVKTGFTEAAGWSLVGSARRGDREMIAVVLGSRTDDDRFEDARVLIEHGFAAFVDASIDVTVTLHRADATASASASAALVVPRTSPEITSRVRLPVEIPATVTVELEWDGDTVATLEPSLRGGERDPSTGGAALGRFVVDRAYAAMRGATRAGLWAAP